MAAVFADLKKAMKVSGISYDIKTIDRAFAIADAAHADQIRKTGDPYISHPISVAIILVELGMDTDTLVASLLHDIVEDCDYDLAKLAEEFGDTVTHLVNGVTKIGRIPFSTSEERQAENVRKMLLAMWEDIRVIIIKLADRLHNMRTMEVMPPQKQRDKSKETMEVYAPIAHRLGMRNMKEELEDLSLRYLDKVAYEEIVESLERRKMTKGDTLNSIKERLDEKLQEMLPEVRIDTRVKSVYGIYRKLYIQGRSFEEIYDIYAIRIIVNSVEECYAALGAVHEMYRLIPNRFKDYISTPKQNMYQSLHTTVVGKEAIPVEVQIRTWEMHQNAEFGIAAHWKYKTGVEADDRLEKRLRWIREIIKSQDDSNNIEDLISTIKNDLSQEDIFVLTPKGDVKSLPIGATIIDFAYSIHSAVGNKMIGAKIDGRIVPLDYNLKTGEICEILTTKSQGHGPSRDWLKIVKTSEARGKIRSWFKKERRDENVIEGKAEIDRELRRNGVSFPPEMYEKFIDDTVKRQHLNSREDLFAAIGYGGVRIFSIIYKAKEDFQKYKKSLSGSDETLVVVKKQSGSKDNVVVEGETGLLIKFARCCNPLPGEDIVGFVTRGYGVTIHRGDCTNAENGTLDEDQQGRWVSAEWEENTQQDSSDYYEVTVDILSVDRDGLLVDISTALGNMHVPVYELNAKTNKNGNCTFIVTFGVASKEQLQNVRNRIKKIRSVISVQRIGA